MVSRTQRTPFAEWWWTIDRLMLAAIGALMLAGIILLLAASPPVATKLGLDPFHFVSRHLLYLVPGIAIMLGDFVSGAAPYPEVGACRLHHGHDVPRGDAGLRHRGKGCAALDRAARRQHPAVRIRQTRFCHSYCLAVCRIHPPSGNAGQQRGARAAAAGDVVSGDAARFRSDHADRAGLGRAVLHRRDAADLGRRAGRGGDHRPCSRLFHRSARCAALQALFRSGIGRHLPDRQCGGIFRARRLVRSRAGRGDGETHLPDSHADFIFAVAAEEFGIALCLLLVALFSFHRYSRAVACFAQRRPVRPFRRRRPCHPVRRASGDQYGGELASDPGKGHDAAVHFLWRVVACSPWLTEWACCWR